MASQAMEVMVVGDDLNGLGWAVKQLVDTNLADPAVRAQVARLAGSLAIREPAADVAVTLVFRRGLIAVQNGIAPRATAYLEAGFEDLAAVSSGQIGPVMAVLRGRVKARGNLWQLLKMSKALITPR